MRKWKCVLFFSKGKYCNFVGKYESEVTGYYLGELPRAQVAQIREQEKSILAITEAESTENSKLERLLESFRNLQRFLTLGHGHVHVIIFFSRVLREFSSVGFASVSLGFSTFT